MKSMGLIGFGRFGQVLFRQLNQLIDIHIYDPYVNVHPNDNIPLTSLESVCRNPLVVVAVPVSAIRSISEQMTNYLMDNVVVMDVCGVKEYPLKIMTQFFPERVQILGSHPLFGPDSVISDLTDHLMILTPQRISDARLKEIKTFWKQFGLKLIEMSAEEQDRLMAWTLALTHFLGRGLNGLPLPDTGIATRDYQNLLRLMEKINRDTWELFEDMHRYNPYTSEMRERLLQSMTELKNKLDKLKPVEF